MENNSSDPAPATPKASTSPDHDYTSNKIAKEDRLPVSEKALYGLGNQSMGMVNHVIEYQVQQVLVYGLGMSPAWKGFIIMIFRIWDAFSDPLVGWFSDNTRSRFGRRRPYMFVGSICMAALLPFVWRFDETWSMIYIAFWFTIFGMIMSTATTLFNIPYQTLKMEMTPDYHERTSINMYSALVSSVFGIIISPWVWKMSQHPFFTGQAPGEEPNTLLGIRALSLWFAGFALILGLIPTFACKERYYQKVVDLKQKKEPLVKSLKMTFSSKPFIMMLGIILAGNLEGLVIGMGGYISLYYVFEGDKVFAATFGGISGSIGGVLGLLAAPLTAWFARKTSKRKALTIICIINVFQSASILVFYNPNYPWLAAVPNILNGILIGAFWVIVPSMKPDIVDEDEVKTGERREASFESIFSWFLRFTGTIFAGFSGFFVVFVGFNIDLGVNQAEGVFQNMIWLMAVIPALLGALQLYIVVKWPLTIERMAEIRETLEARRGKINEAEPETQTP